MLLCASLIDRLGLTPRYHGDLTDSPEAKHFYKALEVIAISLWPKAASAGTSSAVVTEDNCAALESTNGRYYIFQSNQKTMGNGAKWRSALRGAIAKRIAVMVGSIG